MSTLYTTINIRYGTLAMCYMLCTSFLLYFSNQFQDQDVCLTVILH